MADNVSDQLWRMTNKKGPVADALRKAAERTRSRAEAISRREGGTATYSIVDGVRPGGRRYFDVVSDDREEEYGTEDTPRINALRRAARGET